MRTLQTGRCSAGFTLLELIVVIFILSLIMALVLPSFYGIGEGRLKSEAGKMASLLRYLNDSAISTKETYFLRFDLEEDIISWKGPDGEKTEGLKNLSSLNLQSKGTVTKGQVIVFFGPLGIQENIAVHLRDEAEEMTVMFNPLGGRAKIVTSNE